MIFTVPTPLEAEGPTSGPDRGVLRGYLGFQRTTVINICAGLTGEQLASRPLPSTDLTLLGIVRHLAKVERIWLRQRAAAEPVPDLHGGPGNPTDFGVIDPADAEHAVAALTAEQEAGDAAVADLPWSHTFDVRGEAWSLAMVYTHLVAEYARHNGHADLLREAIDGVRAR